MGGAINALLEAEGEKKEEFQTGVIICNSTSQGATNCHALRTSKAGPSSSYTESLGFAGSCLATASPQLPTQVLHFSFP